MAESNKYARTTISMPPELKARMDAVTDEVNWSALACRAFEDKLAELIAKQEVRDMNDVIARLRASKRRAEDEHYQEGATCGREWAESQAEADDLIRLERWKDRCGLEWDSLFTENLQWGSSEPISSLFVYAIDPETKNESRYDAAQTFWESVLGDDTSAADDPQFVKGFAEGALELWDKVKEQL